MNNDVHVSLYISRVDRESVNSQPLQGVRGPHGYGAIQATQGVPLPPLDPADFGSQGVPVPLEARSPDPIVSELIAEMVTPCTEANLTGGPPVRYPQDLFQWYGSGWFVYVGVWVPGCKCRY